MVSQLPTPPQVWLSRSSLVPVSEKSVVQVLSLPTGCRPGRSSYCISPLSCLLLPIIIQPTYQPRPTPSVPWAHNAVMPLHLAHSPSAYSALSSLLCLANFHTLFKVQLKCPQVPPSLSHNPWNTHPLKYIALCQVCLSSISPAVLNRKWFCPPGDSVCRHFLLSNSGWGGGRGSHLHLVGRGQEHC